MSIQSQRLIVGDGGEVSFQVSRPAGTPIRIFILDEAENPALTDAEHFQLGALASVTADDPEEDAIWERYLHG